MHLYLLLRNVDVRDTSLRMAMKSPLFKKLRDGGYLLEDHAGGCILYEKRNQVQEILGC